MLIHDRGETPPPPPSTSFEAEAVACSADGFAPFPDLIQSVSSFMYSFTTPMSIESCPTTPLSSPMSFSTISTLPSIFSALEATIPNRNSSDTNLMETSRLMKDELHTQIDSEEENAKAFQIVNEIILTLKDAKEEARKAAYDVLLDISSSLRDVSSSSSESSEAPYQKLITMIMGYLSGASPHIKSGAVSVLSVLIYKDANIHLSMPDLVPSLLPLLQGKSLEVIKVTVIMEIMIRKCGLSAVELVTPERYRSFVKSVVENRHNKTNSKDAADSNTEAKQDETFTSRHRNRKRKELDTAHEKTGSVKNEKGKKKHIANSTGTKESDISTAAAKVRRFSKIESSYTPGRGRKSNKKNFDKGPWGGQKRKINMSSKDKADQKPASRSTLELKRERRDADLAPTQKQNSKISLRIDLVFFPILSDTYWR
ncbi:hypothetical protein L484_015987 [Morus notabilis]|uniref:RRP12-like protein n=1 Tax=Morus notabilis TaxID=981085 RepID=W9RRA6_9ROSA|nr:hypothetical protein L484_015987 [Morus notabilis]